MRLVKYEKYKNSGIKQLPIIPESWNVSRLADFGSFKKGSNISRKDLIDKGLSAILYGDLYTKYNIVANEIVHKISVEASKKSIKIRNGVILFTGSGETLEDIGKSITYIGKETVFVGGDAIIYTSKNLNNIFLAYCLSAQYTTLQKINEAKGNIIFHVYASRLKNIQISFPSFYEQTQIANYLDNKIKVIDKKTNLLEQKILKYKELRKSIIYNAVTKGGDQNVKLKYSGIDWIGKIPEHWEIVRIKDFTYLKARIGWQGLRSDEFIDNSNWLCITGTDFKNGEIDWNNCYSIEKERYDQDKNIQLRLNDLLITKDGTIGKVALVNYLPKKATLNSGVFVTRPLMSKYSNSFMYWLLNSNVFTLFIDYYKNGSTILHLYQNVFERFCYGLPSLNEQTQIANYLNNKTTTIDNIIQNIEKQIDALAELRKTLINDVVTGKLRVCETVEA